MIQNWRQLRNKNEQKQKKGTTSLLQPPVVSCDSQTQKATNQKGGVYTELTQPTIYSGSSRQGGNKGMLSALSDLLLFLLLQLPTIKMKVKGEKQKQKHCYIQRIRYFPNGLYN